MPRIKPVSFNDLVSPLSQKKIFMLLEVSDPVRCESLNCALAIADYLNIRIDELPNDFEAFVSSGFMTLECNLSEINRAWSEATLDFFRQRKFRDALKAYLFIDEEFIGHSQDGHSSTLDILSEIQQPLKAATVR